MTDRNEILHYHGRRTVDEMVLALYAGTAATAGLHRELSLLHLDKFVALMKSVAETVKYTGNEEL